MENKQLMANYELAKLRDDAYSTDETKKNLAEAKKAWKAVEKQTITESPVADAVDTVVKPLVDAVVALPIVEVAVEKKK